MADDPIAVRVMAEYESFPLWVDRRPGVSNVDPSDPGLGLPQQPAAELGAWSDDYERTYDSADPAGGGFASAEAAAAFTARGRELALAVADTLGPGYAVTSALTSRYPAEGVSRERMRDFGAGGPLAQIPSQGVIKTIYVKTADGWIVIPGDLP